MKYIFNILFSVIVVLSLCCSTNTIDSAPINEGDNDTVKIEAYLYKEPKIPFPQHVEYTNGVIIPNVDRSLMDIDVISYYDKWKKRYVKEFGKDEAYVHYTLEYSVGDAISCSEGHGFGMVITVYMAGADTLAYDTFIKLYRFYKNHPSAINNRLMAWQQDRNGNNSSGADSATDGDLDIAYSLLLAHKQWGSTDEYPFLNDAIAMINAISEYDINPDYKTIELGDWVRSGSKYYLGTRCCDFMLDHLRSFNKFNSIPLLMEAIDTVYNVINSVADETTGLYPDFVTIENGDYVACAPNYLEGPYDGDYYYNSCRAPWRIATDYIVYGDDRALQVLNRLNNWIKQSAGGRPSMIKGGYKLDGTPLNSWSDMAFTAPFGVSAMVSADHQEWLDALWEHMLKTKIADGAYFGNSIKMMCLIVMSGNWWLPENY